MLELALLGALQEGPMHGYELRKHLSMILGSLRAAFSYGSLYPTLRRMREAGWITDSDPAHPEAPATGRRSKVVYRITPAGEERLTERLSHLGPGCYDDSAFGVHFALFGHTDPDVRLRLLEGRRRRVEERREGLVETLASASARLDEYTLELQRYGLEAADREVRWLNELIASEQAGTPPHAHDTASPRAAESGDHQEEE